MKPNPTPLVLVAAAVLLTGCANLFHADFESGIPGQPPIANPPGPPAGDRISNGPADLFFVSTEDAISGSQSLTIREVVPSLDPDSNQIVFRTAPINDADAPIYITWRGFFPAPGGISVNIGFLGKSFGNVTFENGQIRMFDTPVGNYDIGDSHTVIVSLFPASQTYRFAIFGDATLAQDFAQADMAPINGTPSNEGFVEVAPTASTAQNCVYVMDDVTVSYKEPKG
jgi:hypothetical protein